MAQSRVRRVTGGVAAVLLLGQAGCAGLSAGHRDVPALALHDPAAPAAALAKPVAIRLVSQEEPAAEPLTLARLTALAEQHNPDIAAARARAEAARGRLVQAGLYPNPMVGWEADEVGHNRKQAGEQGPRVMQTVVTGGKLRLSQAAAAEALAAQEWQALTTWYAVLTRVRVAFYEVLAARREVQTTKEVVRLAEENLSIARRLLKAELGTRADELRAQVELDQTRIRLGVARQRLDAAHKVLAAVTGLPTLPAESVAGRLEDGVPVFEWDRALQTALTRSSEVLEAQANVLQAEQLLRRAWAQNKPDVQLAARPFYSFPDNDSRVMLEVSFPLPVFNRNQGNIVAAQADLARAREEVRQVELRLTERLALAFQRYRNARLQVESYQKQILPNARESLRLVRLGYEKGDRYDLTGVLQAQQTLVQAQLTYVQALGELWRAASEIAGLVQQDEL